MYQKGTNFKGFGYCNTISAEDTIMAYSGHMVKHIDFNDGPTEQVVLLMGIRSETVRWQSHYGLYLQWTSHLIRELWLSESMVHVTDISAELGTRVI